jgi:hypothetical protein
LSDPKYVYATDIPYRRLHYHPYRVEDPYALHEWEVGVKRVDQALNDFRGEDPNGRRYFATGAAKVYGALRAVCVERHGRSWYIVREQGFHRRDEARAAADRWARENGAINYFINEDPWLD